MRNATDSDQRYETMAPQMTSSLSVSKWAFIAYVVFSLAAIAFVPTMVPSPPSASDSYLFGYDNRAGTILLLFLLFIGVLWTRGLNLQFLPLRESRPVSKTTLIFALLAVLCGCVAMYAFAGSHTGFAESFYLIDRSWLLWQGRIPYREIEFAYGPGLLYGPLILKYLLPVNIAQAYYLFWVLNHLLGIWLLFKTVNMIDYPSASRRSIFLLLFSAGLFAILRMGTNYTFLRFCCPIFFVLVTQRFFKASGTFARVRAVITCVVFSATLLLISPEIAIAYAFACVCVCMFSRTLKMSHRFATIAVLLLAFSVVFWTAVKLHILDTLLADGSGAISFPILIAPHIFVFFCALFVCGCYVFERLRDQRIDDNTFGLVAFSVPMVAAALGRCDPSHVFWNGLAVFLASMFYVSNYKLAWRVYVTAFIVFSFLLPSLGEGYRFGAAIKQVIAFNGQKRDWPHRQDLARLFPSWSGRFLAPFGYRPGGVGIYESTRIEFGRFEELTDVSTRHSVNEKIAELQEHPELPLLLPYNFEGACVTHPHEERRYISFLFVFPFRGSVAHPESVRAPICEYIRDNYRLAQVPDDQSFWYGLWMPRASNQLN
jgi:hypothetical protein